MMLRRSHRDVTRSEIRALKRDIAFLEKVLGRSGSRKGIFDQPPGSLLLVWACLTIIR
jgi:hypothetical protein